MAHLPSNDLIGLSIELNGKCLFQKVAKNPIKANGHNHHMENKREGQKIHHPHKNQRREKVNPFRGRKLSHPQPLSCCLHANREI